VRRRPERSEGCLAIARKDRMVGFILKALSEGLDHKFFVVKKLRVIPKSPVAYFNNVYETNNSLIS